MDTGASAISEEKDIHTGALNSLFESSFNHTNPAKIKVFRAENIPGEQRFTIKPY